MPYPAVIPQLSRNYPVIIPLFSPIFTDIPPIYLQMIYKVFYRFCIGFVYGLVCLCLCSQKSVANRKIFA